ncbi:MULTISPECIES: hypothetical protein [Bartonella]|uniref:hypothetical protein n=1 Tax=Bartonella TaxID=773 RepID=UPI00236291C3|nr:MULTISPECIES: hypothetical protein [Bartonella]
MKYTLNLLIALFIILGCCEVQFLQTIAGIWKKYDTNQLEKKVPLYMEEKEEDLRNNPAYIEWCIVHDKHPDCNEGSPRGEIGRNGSHGHW